MRTQLEWTREHDRVFGPFLIAPDKNGGLAIIVATGNDEYRGANLRISGFGGTFMLALPSVLFPPQKRKVHPKWDKPTIERLGRDWYWDVTEREFGASLYDGLFSLKYGRQTHDSTTDKVLTFFLPWTQWRFTRKSYFDPDGQHLRTFFEKDRKPGFDGGREEWRFSESLQTTDFAFDDYDGERITAKTKIEELEWRFGRGWFKWLSLFRRPKVVRSLDLKFTSEVGRRKGSWKGGAIGHSTEMQPGDTPERAFRRYCEKEGLTFIGRSDAAAT